MEQIDKPPIIKGHNDQMNVWLGVQRDADAEYYEGKYGRELDEMKAWIKQCYASIADLKGQLKIGEQMKAETLKEVGALLDNYEVGEPYKAVKLDLIADIINRLNVALKSGTIKE